MDKAEMMEVRMTETKIIYADGIHPQTVSKGQKITLPLLVAEGLIRDKMAVTVLEIVPLKDPPKSETKDDKDKK